MTCKTLLTPLPANMLARHVQSHFGKAAIMFAELCKSCFPDLRVSSFLKYERNEKAKPHLRRGPKRK